MYKRFGDSEFAIMFIEKYTFIIFCLVLGFLRKWIIKLVNTGAISKHSNLLYLILPAGYFIVFWIMLTITHILLVILF